MPEVTPLPHDPTYEVAKFLAYLKKRGALWELSDCERNWNREGFDIKNIVLSFDPDLIGIYRSKGGKKVILLRDKKWADQWMIYYDIEVPHHGQWKRLKNSFQ